MPRPDGPLPDRLGVAPSCVVLPAGPWWTVAEFLVQRFPAVTEAEWHARLARGEVVRDNGRPVAGNHPYRAQIRLWYYRELPDETPVPFQEEVLFQDDHLIVVDKPHFLPVVPGGRYLQETVLVRLRRRLGLDTLTPLHRLDRETAGLVMLSVRPADRGAYHAMFRSRAVSKVYEAVAPWREALAWPQVRRSRMAESAGAFMQMHEVPGEPNAETTIECLGPCGPGLALYRLTPLTGQRHQLRVHMAALGLPLHNDRIYPVLQPQLGDDGVPEYTRPLQLLARSLAFDDPVTGERRTFESRRVLSDAVFGHDARHGQGGHL